MSEITQHILPGGLRFVHLHVPGANAAHFGVAVHAGSSHESSPEQYGLAHFVEHTIFKGTDRRRAWHIANRMESVGGELNAFTTKEDTVVYSTFPKGALMRAVDLVVDLILNSRFPKLEIDKEREVICDEINSYLDSPADAVYDDFEDMLYRGMPAGHNILGTTESVAAISGEMCRRWLDTYYVASNMVCFYAGPYSAETVVKKASPLLALIPRGDVSLRNIPADFSPREPFRVVRHADTHQAHTVMGCSLPRLDAQQRITLALLTNVLGGPGMNSLFNIALREKRGLVYTVESSLSTLTGTTMFTTYFGTDPETNDKCIALVRDIIDKVSNGYLDQRRLGAAKKQYRGQTVIARENTENRIIGAARAILLHGHAFTLAETDSLLSAITPDDMAASAASLASLSHLTLSR